MEIAMSDPASNKAQLAQIYRRWHETKGACLDEFIGIFADDISFRSLAQGAAPVTFTAAAIGPAQLRGYFDGLLAGWTMIHFTVDHMIADGDRVAVVGSTAWTCKATGKVCETPKIDLWRFRDGRAVEFFELYDTAGMLAAATPG
jgi:ketosteroid isomerase-like protein